MGSTKLSSINAQVALGFGGGPLLEYRDESGERAETLAWWARASRRAAHPITLLAALGWLIGGLVGASYLENGQFGINQQNSMTPAAVASVAVFLSGLICGGYAFGLALIQVRQQGAGSRAPSEGLPRPLCGGVRGWARASVCACV
jgi:hypothetical protein